jgi:hypothetical protein
LFGHVGQSRGPLSAARRPRRAAFAGAAPFTASRVVHRGAGPVRHWVRWGDTIAISAAILLLSHKLSLWVLGRRGRFEFEGGRRRRFSRWVPRARIPIKRSLLRHYFARHQEASVRHPLLQPACARRVSQCCDQLHRLAEFFNCARRDSSVTLVQKRDSLRRAILGGCSHLMLNLMSSFDRARHRKVG